MGSVSDFAAARRALEVLSKAPAGQEPLTEVQTLVGQRVTVKSVALTNEHQDRISGSLVLGTQDGQDVTAEVETGLVLVDEGVCSYALEHHYDADTLRRMVEAAIADRGNGLSDRDREILDEDLQLLDE